LSAFIGEISIVEGEGYSAKIERKKDLRKLPRLAAQRGNSAFHPPRGSRQAGMVD
jgi:hypothetical protein